MKRAFSTFFCLALLACADEGDDDTQVASNAAAAPPVFESNTVLELLALDRSSCDVEATGLQPGFAVYRDASSFREAYLAARPRASQVPPVDFGSYVVIGAVLAQEGGSCRAAIDVVRATNHDEAVAVVLGSTSTGELCDVPAGQLAHAFVFARVDRLDKEYEPTESAGEPAACPAAAARP